MALDRHEVFTGVAVIAITGAIVYSSKLLILTGNIFGRKKGRITANQAIATPAITGAGGNPNAFTGGPSIYTANAPWPFGPNVGNTIPATSAGVTLPGADQADFLGFNTGG
jgi:hypothetical protein